MSVEKKVKKNFSKTFQNFDFFCERTLSNCKGRNIDKNLSAIGITEFIGPWEQFCLIFFNKFVFEIFGKLFYETFGRKRYFF